MTRVISSIAPPGRSGIPARRGSIVGNGDYDPGGPPALPTKPDEADDPRRYRSGLLRVLVIDRRSLTRDCLVAALTDLPDIGEIIAVADAVDAPSHVGAERRVDAALVNLAGDAFDGASIQRLRSALDAVLPPGAIVLLTGLVDGGHILAALRHGVLGFLNSDTPTDVIIEALQLVSGGWTVYPPLDPKLLARSAEDAIDRPAIVASYSLTERQTQVLDGLQKGMTNRDIAAGLGISERAVKAHVQELMRRMGASNRTQIVAMVAGLTRRVPSSEIN